jgi:hypothetical protein
MQENNLLTSPRKKLPKRDRSAYHAFIYINILKTEMGMDFPEIAEKLYVYNYRTRDGGNILQK